MSFGIELDPSPGEVVYFEISGRHYALACAPEDFALSPSGNDGGRFLTVSGRHHTRQLSDSANDWPPGYEVRSEGGIVLIYYQGENIGWAGDVSNARGLVEKHLAEQSQRFRRSNYSNRRFRR